MKKLYFMMSMAAAVALTGNAAVVNDTITGKYFPVEKASTYASFEVTLPSSNEYSAQLAIKNLETQELQMRSNNNNSGIVATNTVGEVKSVTVDFTEDTNDARVVQVYGSNVSFAGPTDLYEEGAELIGEIAKADGLVGTLEVEGYRYVGIRSKSGALYLNSVIISYEDGQETEEPTPEEPGYPVYINAGAHGTVTVKSLGEDGTPTIISNGDRVEEGDLLEVVIKADPNYVISKIVIDGEEEWYSYNYGYASTTIGYYVEEVEEAVTIEVEFSTDMAYCNNYEGLTVGAGARRINGLTVASGENEMIYDVAGSKDIYFDFTDMPLEVGPGQVVVVTPQNAGSSWMHNYLWVDFNRDFEFEAVLSANGGVAGNSELVDFCYYNGVNGQGVAVADNVNGYELPLSFVVPENAEEGAYRVRFIIAWDNINPCGPELDDKDRLDVTGGYIIDFEINVNKALSGVEAVEAADADVAPVYYNLQGVRVNNPANGIYIVVKGDKAEKVLVK